MTLTVQQSAEPHKQPRLTLLGPWVTDSCEWCECGTRQPAALLSPLTMGTCGRTGASSAPTCMQATIMMRVAERRAICKAASMQCFKHHTLLDALVEASEGSSRGRMRSGEEIIAPGKDWDGASAGDSPDMKKHLKMEEMRLPPCTYA
eukprot:1142210-Pelagomonas_calceolata.AAC.2